MRRFIAVLAISLPGIAAGNGDPEGLALVRNLARMGAPELAASVLARVSIPSPGDRDALRVILAAAMPDPRLALDLAAKLPSDVDSGLAREAYAAAARAALALPRPDLARNYLTRLFWYSTLSPDEVRVARAQVVESYLAEENAARAFPLMLRFRTELGPPGPTLAATWANALLKARLTREAAALLDDLDPAGPVAARVRMENGLLPAAETLARANGAVAADPSPAWWGVLRSAARSAGDTAAEVTALEHLVAAAPTDSSGLVETLWSTYRQLALEVGNSSQLLAGADLGWSDRASALEATDKARARAVWAYLSREAKDASLRQTAQIRLAAQLSGAGVPRAAVAMFRAEALSLPREVRYALGDWAAEADEPEFAARLWKDLEAPPPGVASRDWELKRAAVFVRGGEPEAAVLSVSRTLTGGAPLTREQVHRLAQLALDLADLGNTTPAERILKLLVTDAEPFQRRDLLFALGRLADDRGDATEAASYFLQTAGGSADALSQIARIRAAASLARAGFKRDAKRQYEEIINSAQDPGNRESARRALARLGP